MEIAQSGLGVGLRLVPVESYKAYERPEDEVTGNKSDGYARRAHRARPG